MDLRYSSSNLMGMEAAAMPTVLVPVVRVEEVLAGIFVTTLTLREREAPIPSRELALLPPRRPS